MINKHMNRRQFIQTSALGVSSAIAFASGWQLSQRNLAQASGRLLVSGYRDHKTQSHFGVIVTDTMGNILSDFSVPDRVHMADLFPNAAKVLVNSRKPFAPLRKYNLAGELLAELMPPEQMHFEGHSVFSDDGNTLYSTASNYQQGKGYVLEINASDLSLQRIISTDGIGPHELVIDADQLFIANTGVLTHPDSGRDPLNIDTMQSELVQLDLASGMIVHRWSCPTPALSARHIAQMADGSILVGCQYQKNNDRPASVAIAKPDQTTLQLLQPNNEHYYWDMKGYTASVRAFSASSPFAHQALISNPRGHLLSHWQPNTVIAPQTHKMAYSKGIVLGKTEAWISAGAGELWHWDANSQKLQKWVTAIKADFWWENHLHSRVLG